MEVRVAVPTDIDELVVLYDGARAALASLGIDQWQNGNPTRSQTELDIESGGLRVCVDDGAIVGVAYLEYAGEPDYDAITGAWLTDSDSRNPKYAVVHRIATDAHVARRGIGSFLMTELAEESAKRGCESLRIDTHEGNVRMRGMLTKLGFEECGIIYLGNSTESTKKRIAYEKLF